MFPKKILFLVGGYIAGNIVHALYSDKKNQTKKLQKKEDLKMLAENFLSTQKKLLSDIEDKILSESNKASLQEKKAELQAFSQKYFREGERLLSELQSSSEYQNIKTQGVSLFSKLSLRVASLWEDIKQKTSQAYPSEQVPSSESHDTNTQDPKTLTKTSKTVQKISRPLKTTKSSAKKVSKK